MTDNPKAKSIGLDQFDAVIQDNEIVFLDFWAQWCAPCKQFSQVYEKVAGLHNNVTFAKIDIEKEQELADTFQIRSIPHLMVFKQGIIIYSEAGSMPESTLQELVKQAIDIDVSEIRAQLDKENSTE